MTLRVLHIFAPYFRQRFGGPIYNWGFYFPKWDHPEVEHFVLDTESGQVIGAREAFDFELSGDQRIVDQWERLAWLFRLGWYLHKYHQDYDLVHFHLLWWGSLLSAWWLNQRQVPTLYESVLLGSDTPGGIIEEKLGRVKVRLLQQFMGILAISDQIADDYVDYGFSPTRVYTNMNCLDTDLFHPPDCAQQKARLRAQFNLPVEAIVLLYVGSLIQRKGVDLLIEAFIAARRQNPRLHLWLVGPQNVHENPSMDEAFVEEIKKQVAEAGLDHEVTFSGLIPERDILAQVYQAADAFIFPSRKEGLPNVVLEAMASGLPVIVSDLPGLKNVVIPGKNGLVVPIGDSKGLHHAIESLIDGQINAEKLGHNARAYILAQHSFSAWETHMTHIYVNLLDQKGY